MSRNYTDAMNWSKAAIAIGTLTIMTGCSTPRAEISPIGELATTEPQVLTLEEDEAENTEEDTSVQLTPLAADVSQQFYVANIEDPKAAIAFLTELRQAAYTKDKEKLASLMHYPAKVYTEQSATAKSQGASSQADRGLAATSEVAAESITYDTPEELIDAFDQVMTEPILKAMVNVKISELMITPTEVMIDFGKVSFAQYEGEGIRVKSIHHK